MEIHASGPIAVSRCRKSGVPRLALQMSWMLSSRFWQGKGNDRIATSGAQTIMAASGDNQLSAARYIPHWCRLPASRQVGTPELGAVLYVEGWNTIVHGGGDKDEAAGGGFTSRGQFIHSFSARSRNFTDTRIQSWYMLAVCWPHLGALA